MEDIMKDCYIAEPSEIFTTNAAVEHGNKCFVIGHMFLQNLIKEVIMYDRIHKNTLS